MPNRDVSEPYSQMNGPAASGQGHGPKTRSTSKAMTIRSAPKSPRSKAMGPMTAW